MRMHLHRLIKRQRDDKLFVAVRSQVSALLRETVSQRMFVVFVETLGRRRVDFAVEKFVTMNRTAVGTGGLTTPSHSRHSQMLANFFLQSPLISAPHGVNFGAVLVEVEGGHGLDLLRLSGFRALVHVDFEKDGVRIFGR